MAGKFSRFFFFLKILFNYYLFLFYFSYLALEKTELLSAGISFRYTTARCRVLI